MNGRFDEVFAGGFIAGTVSGARKGASPEHGAKKVTLRRFEKRGEVFIQFTYLLNDRALHENRAPQEAGTRVEELLRGGFSQAVLFTRRPRATGPRAARAARESRAPSSRGSA